MHVSPRQYVHAVYADPGQTHTVKIPRKLLRWFGPDKACVLSHLVRLETAEKGVSPFYVARPPICKDLKLSDIRLTQILSSLVDSGLLTVHSSDASVSTVTLDWDQLQTVLGGGR